jgi:outer membrane protein OmpA-like peptidoglycan-associated protein
VLTRIARYSYLAAGATAVIVVTAGCRAVLGAPVGGLATTAPLPLTVRIAPSMLVTVTGPGPASQRIRQVITETARPREDLEVLQATERGRALIAATSPAPARMVVPGKPAPPAAGASSFQQGQYQRALTRWRGQVAAAKRAVAARTRAAVAHWVGLLGLRSVLARPDATPSGSLTGECSLATNAVSGLVNQAGSRFAGRVVLLAATSLTGRLAPGELDGDDVIVVTSYLPTAAAASVAQLNLLAAGASFAAILGPEATAAQLDHLVSESLSGRAVSDVVSGRALFANDSAALRPAAARVLAPVLAQLRRPGATAVVNGFASTPGRPRHNQVLSQDRASAVAGYLEARGIPRSSLVVVGHGATNLVTRGSSAENRRVVVVVAEPTGAGS